MSSLVKKNCLSIQCEATLLEPMQNVVTLEQDEIIRMYRLLLEKTELKLRLSLALMTSEKDMVGNLK